jgi:ribosome-associated protein
MISVNSRISIPESELAEVFIRASGPGGQKVNKTSSAVQLRFDVKNSPSLPDSVRERLVRLAGRRVTAEGVLVIEASRYRTQSANRRDGRRRLEGLLRRAARPPRPRKATRPSRAARQRRLDAKKKRGQAKRRRRPVAPEEE